MNLPDAIERARRLRSEALIRAGKWEHLDSEVSEAHAMDAQALAVCLEALAEHAPDGGALLREVNPKAYSTLKSAPPLTPEEKRSL